MRVNEKMKKALSALLCVSMLVQNAPVVAFAAQEDCTHHTVHTAECGYMEAVEAQPCTHSHDSAVCGYVEAVEEVLCACTETDESGALVHTEGCSYVAPVTGADCTHSHDASCGYAEAVEGKACTFECETCPAEEADATAVAEVKTITTEEQNALLLSVEEKTGVSIHIGGVELFDGEYLANGSTEASVAPPESGGYAYFKDGTLTLSNYIYEGTGYIHAYNNSNESNSIFADGNLTIKLVGNNVIKNVVENFAYQPFNYCCGIKVIGNLTVSGDDNATLTTTGGVADVSDGIYAEGNVVITGGTVTATGSGSNWDEGEYCSWSRGICSANVTVTGGKVFATGGEAEYSCGISAEDNVTITNGIVTTTSSKASADSYSIIADGITVEGGMVTAISGVAMNSYGICVTSNVSVTGGTLTTTSGDADIKSTGISAYDVTITGGQVTASGGNTTGTGESYGIYVISNVTLNGGTVTAIGGESGKCSYGIYAEYNVYTASNVTVNGGTVNATGSKAGNYSYGIWAQIVAVENGTVIASSGAAVYSYGIYARDYVTIKDGSVTTTGGTSKYSYGIAAEGNVMVSSGELTATGGTATAQSYGIWGLDTTVEGSTVIATGGATTDNYSESYGIYARGDGINLRGNITIKSGTVTAIGDDYGIYAVGDVIVNGGTVTSEGALRYGEDFVVASTLRVTAADSVMNPLGPYAPEQHTTYKYIRIEDANECTTEGSHITEKDENKATCQNKAVCDLCGASYGEIAPENHTIENHVCTLCGVMEIVFTITGDKEWQDGDAISVRVDDETYKLTADVADGGTVTWTPHKPLYWGGDAEVAIYAAYPYAEDPTSYSIPTDQSTEDGLKAADWMTFCWTGAPTTDEIEIELEHRMAKVTVEYILASQFTEMGDVTAKVYSNAAAMTFADGEISAGQSDTWITPYNKEAEMYFTAYVAPGEYNMYESLGFIVDGVDETFDLFGAESKNMTFKEGGEYNFEVKVGKDKEIVWTDAVTITDHPGGWNSDAEVGSIGTPDEGKIQWADGDQVFVTLNSDHYGVQTRVYVFNGETWECEDVWGDAFEYLDGEVPTVTAIYAPCYAYDDGDEEIVLADGMQLGMTEYLEAKCSLEYGEINVNFAEVKRTYSRLRIVAQSNQTLAVTATDFTPVGTVESGTHTYTLTADDKGNAYLYGIFAEGANLTVNGATSMLHYTNGTEHNKSYAVCASHTAAEGAEATCLGYRCEQCGLYFGNKDESKHVTEMESNKATCQKQAVCDLCGTSYGEVDTNNHVAGCSATYAPTEDGNKHIGTYSLCGATVTEDHTFFNDNGKCDVCGIEALTINNVYVQPAVSETLTGVCAAEVEDPDEFTADTTLISEGPEVMIDYGILLGNVEWAASIGVMVTDNNNLDGSGYTGSNVKWVNNAADWYALNDEYSLYDKTGGQQISAYYPYSYDGILHYDLAQWNDQPLYGTAEVTSASVNLTLERKMAKLAVNIAGLPDGERVEAVELNGIYLTADFNGATGILTSTGEPGAIGMRQDGKAWTTMLIPMDQSEVALRIQLANGDVYAATFQLAPAAGKAYNLTVSLGHGDATATPNDDGKTHALTCKDCGETFDNENCSGGEEHTCMGFACEKCGGWYGEGNADNHVKTGQCDCGMTVYGIWVSDIPVTSENKNNVTGWVDGGIQVQYDPETNILYFTDAKITDLNDDGIALKVDGDITLYLAGESYAYYGDISVAGNLTITGSGYLNVDGVNFGIRAKTVTLGDSVHVISNATQAVDAESVSGSGYSRTAVDGAFGGFAVPGSVGYYEVIGSNLTDDINEDHTVHTRSCGCGCGTPLQEGGRTSGATCQSKAVCSLCGEYGEKDLTNHGADCTVTYTPTEGGKHTATYSKCGTKTEEVRCDDLAFAVSEDGSSCTVTCRLCRAVLETVTILAPACKIYGDGASCEITILLDGEAVPNPANITYYKMNDNQWEVLAAAPTGAGTYRAEGVNVGGESDPSDDFIIYVEYTIAKADPTYTVPENLTATYGDTLVNVNLPTGFAWTDATQSVGNAGTNKFTATYDLQNSNYNVIENIAVPVQVAPKPVTSAEITISGSHTYTGSDIKPAVTVAGYEANTDYEVAYSNNVNAGTATVTVSFKGNYSGTVTETFQIGKATLTVTAENKSMTTGQALPELTYTITGFVGGEDASVLKKQPVAVTSADGNTAGTFDITVSGAEADNYGFTYVNGTLSVVDHQHAWTYTADGDTITATCGNAATCPDAEQTITVSAQGKTYDGTAVTATLTGSIDGVATPAITYFKNGEELNESVIHAGTYTARITVGGVTASAEFTIDPATPVLVWDDHTTTYTGEPADLPALSITLVNGETFSGSITCTYDDGKPGLPTDAGTYAVTASVAATGNYTAASKTIQLTITQAAAPAIAWPTAAALTYGQKLSESALTSEDTNGTFAWQDGSIVPTVTNNGYVVVYTPEDTDNYDYTGVERTKTISVTVSKAASSVTAAPTAKKLTYTGEAQALVNAGATADGKLVYSLAENGEFTEAIPVGTNAGEYTVWYYVQSDDNHADSAKASVKVTIAKAQAVITVDTTAITVTYGETVTLPEATTNFGTVICDKTAGDLVNAGTYTVTYSVEGNANCEGAEKKLTVTVEKKAVAEPTVTGIYTYTGSEQTVALSVVESYMSVASGNKGTDAGSYEVEIALDNNHKWAEGSDGKIQWTIAKAQAAITVDTNPINVTYGDTVTLPTATANFGTVTCNKTAADLKNAGTYTVTYSVAGTGNYDGDTVSITVTVNAKPITVTADAVSKTYGEADPELTYTVSGLVNGDPITVVLERTQGENVGTYAIAQKTLDAGRNYTIAYTGADLVINAKPITAADVALNGSLAYTGEELTQNITVAEGITYEVTGNKATNAGSYQLTVTGTGNFTGEVKVAWTIKEASAKLTQNPAAKTLTYNGAEQALVTAGATADGKLVYSLSENGTYAETIPTGKNAGEYTVWYYIQGDDNHGDSAKVSVKITIAKAQVTVTVTAKDKAYDGTTTATLEATVNGVAQGDVLAVAGITGQFSDANAGENKTVSINASQANLTGDNAANYTIAQVNTSTTATITKAPVAAPAAGVGYSLDYFRELMTVAAGYEVVDEQNNAVTSGSVESYLGKTLKVRLKETANQEASAWTSFALAERPAQPNVSVKNETLKGKRDGAVSGITAAMEYSTDNGNTWTGLQNASEISNLQANTTILVRVKATQTAPHGAVKTCTIAEGAAITVSYVSTTQEANGMPAQLTGQSYGTKLVKPADPTAKNTDFAFRGWYKDAACTDSWNFEEDALAAETVTLYAKWEQVYFSVTAEIKDHTDSVYSGNVQVKLMRGDTLVNSVTGTSGRFAFSRHVEAGMYNLVAVYTDDSGEHTKTELITVDHDETFTLKLPAPGVNSHLTISNNAQTPDVMVGGLDAEAEAVKQQAGTNATVEVEMTVSGKTENQVPQSVVSAVGTATGGAMVEYLDITVTKQVNGGEKAEMTETATVLEIVVPYDGEGKANLRVFRHHGGALQKFTNSNSRADQTFFYEDGNIHIFTNQFSNYMIAYDVKYTVTFDANGGTVTSGSMETATNGKLSTLPVPVRTGYVFQGWYTAKTGGTKVTTDTVFTADAAVWAHWSGYNITVAGTTGGTVTVNKTDAPAGTAVTIVVTPNSGYSLSTLTVKDAKGNYYSLGATNDNAYIFQMPAADVTVTATFVRNSTAVADTTNPKTGDDFQIAFWSGMMMTTMLGVAAMMLNKKKFFEK